MNWDDTNVRFATAEFGILDDEWHFVTYVSDYTGVPT